MANYMNWDNELSREGSLFLSNAELQVSSRTIGKLKPENYFGGWLSIKRLGYFKKSEVRWSNGISISFLPIHLETRFMLYFFNLNI